MKTIMYLAFLLASAFINQFVKTNDEKCPLKEVEITETDVQTSTPIEVQIDLDHQTIKAVCCKRA